jgi:spoIIIJ-associated protein
MEAAVARETEKRAPSVEEAVEAALHELGVSEQEARIDVLQEPRSGVLGIGSHEAVVRVSVNTPDSVKSSDPDSEDLEEQADTAADFLEELVGHMGIDAVAEPTLHHDHMYVDLVGEDADDMALLIGRHGQTLDAIQELTRMVVGRRLDERVRVIVDVEDYRKRREERLEEKAGEAAERVLRTGTEEVLEPMNPFERKIVHDAVSEIDGVESSSRGEDPDRSVVIRRR